MVVVCMVVLDGGVFWWGGVGCGGVWRVCVWCWVGWRGVVWCGVAWRGVAWLGAEQPLHQVWVRPTNKNWL